MALPWSDPGQRAIQKKITIKKDGGKSKSHNCGFKASASASGNQEQ